MGTTETASPQALEDAIAAYNEAWNGHDLDAIMSMHAPDMVFANHTAGESATGQEVRSLPNGGAVFGVVFSPNGAMILTWGQDRAAKLWVAGTGQELATLSGHVDAINKAAFSPQGDRIATASVDRSAILWDVETGRHVRSYEGHVAGVTGVAFSPDGRRGLSGGLDRSVRVWDLDGGPTR